MARRMRSAFGCVERVRDGVWRVRWWGDEHDGRGYRRCSMTVRGSRRDATEALAAKHVEHGHDTPVPTLEQAYRMWWLPQLDDRLERGELARSTYEGYVSRWERHVRPAFGAVPVTDIRPLDVQRWLLGMTKAMARSSLIVLRKTLAMCVQYDVLDRNVAKEDYRKPTGVSRSDSAEVWTVSEMERALGVLRGSAAYVPAVLCGVGSCRVGESLGARVDLGEVRPLDVSGMRVAVVDVRRTVGEVGAVSADGALKTRQSVRPVVIPEPWSLDVLSVGGTWLCDDGCGEPMSQHRTRDLYVRALRAAGIDPIPMRNLRNSWRTYMRWELGVPEDMLEKMMGHAGRNVGEIHYDRPREEVFARTAAEAWLRHRAGEKCPSWDDLGRGQA